MRWISCDPSQAWHPKQVSTVMVNVINIVTSEFRHGSFTQKLQGFRRGGQELKDKGNASNRLNPATPGAASGSAP